MLFLLYRCAYALLHPHTSIHMISFHDVNELIRNTSITGITGWPETTLLVFVTLKHKLILKFKIYSLKFYADFFLYWKKNINLIAFKIKKKLNSVKIYQKHLTFFLSFVSHNIYLICELILYEI